MPTINLGDNWAAASAAGAIGDTFTIAAGTHRLQSLEPKQGQTFTCAARGTVIMSGAQILTSPTVSGATWYYTGQIQGGSIQGVARIGQPRGNYPEDVFFDGVPLLHVASLGAVGVGSWFFDYVADRIYVGTDPTGHVVETSVTPVAFVCQGGVISGVTISNLIIEKYASPGNQGAIGAQNGSGWTVNNCEVRYCHSTGIVTGLNSIVTNNFTHHCGQAGIGAFDATGQLWDNNEISFNGNYYDPFWGSGGLKVAFVRNCTISNNFTHHNYGGGLWCDIDCENVIFELNRCEDNEQFGIFQEIGWACIIRNNIVQRNGFTTPGNGPAQAGIFVAASANVQIYGNTVVDNSWAITVYEDARGNSSAPGHAGVTWRTTNLDVHDNIIRQDGNAAAQGYSGMQSLVGTAPFTSLNNHWTHNTYYLGAAPNYFMWQGSIINEISWQAFGNDVTGSFFRGAVGTATVTGTVTSAMTEADVVAGGKTIVITLASGTWVN